MLEITKTTKYTVTGGHADKQTIWQTDRSTTLPVDGADGGNIFLITDIVGEETVTDLPGEHGRVLSFVFTDIIHHLGRGHLRLGPTDHTRFNRPRFVVPIVLANKTKEKTLDG